MTAAVDTELCAGPGCTNPRPPAPATGGTRARFCSEACRKRAHRAQRRAQLVSDPRSGARNPGSPPAGMTRARRWQPGQASEPAPQRQPGHCEAHGTERVWTPRGTMTACVQCGQFQLPPEAARAHTRQAGDRQIRDQAHRDEQQLQLGEARQELLDYIRDLRQEPDLPAWARGRLAELTRMARDADSLSRVDEIEQLVQAVDDDLGSGAIAEDPAVDEPPVPPGTIAGTVLERHDEPAASRRLPWEPGLELGAGAALSRFDPPAARQPTQAGESPVTRYLAAKRNGSTPPPPPAAPLPQVPNVLPPPPAPDPAIVQAGITRAESEITGQQIQIAILQRQLEIAQGTAAAPISGAELTAAALGRRPLPPARVTPVVHKTIDRYGKLVRDEQLAPVAAPGRRRALPWNRRHHAA